MDSSTTMNRPSTVASQPLYLIRFSQSHTSFRTAELEALEKLVNEHPPPELIAAYRRWVNVREGNGKVTGGGGSARGGIVGKGMRGGMGQVGWRVKVEVVRYVDDGPFCLVRFRLFYRQSKVDARNGGGDSVGVGEAGEGDGAELKERDEVETEIVADEELLVEVARAFVSRSVQAKGVYEVWGLADGDGVDTVTGVGPRLATAKTDVTSNVEQPQDGVEDDESLSEEDSTFTTTAEAIGAPVLHPLYEALHTSTLALSAHRLDRYRTDPALRFRFSLDAYNHSHSMSSQRHIINSFAYLAFSGDVRMSDPTEQWVVFEEWMGATSAPITLDKPPQNEGSMGGGKRWLRKLYFGRLISTQTLRGVVDKHDLKKRPYISTTSMDAELALITANLALAAPGKVFLDPFCGTGGFMIAAAELGVWVLGSDIDGRSFRGKKGRGVEGGVGRNVKKYGLEGGFGGCFTGDLVNTPLRTCRTRWLDGLICDPPYGVREGLKVLGTRKDVELVDGQRVPCLLDGVPAHTLPGYVAPKKPYAFERMLDDILDFAARTLVDEGRLAFWMPSANENELGEEVETDIPSQPALTLMHVCVQRFNRWSRRLLVYERKKGELKDLVDESLAGGVGNTTLNGVGRNADDLNAFRRRYFQAFAVDSNPNGP